MLSSSTAPRAPASCELRQRVHLDLDLDQVTHAARRLHRCADTAGDRDVVVLDQHRVSRPNRWLEPPPTRTAYFCAARRPGMVLRVHTTFALVPAIASTMPRVAEAIPTDGTGNSGAVRLRSGRRALVRGPPRSDRRVPRAAVGTLDEHLDRRIDQPERGGGEIQSCNDAVLASHQRVARARGHHRSLVRSPARPRSSSSAACNEGSTMMAGEVVGRIVHVILR